MSTPSGWKPWRCCCAWPDGPAGSWAPRTATNDLLAAAAAHNPAGVVVVSQLASGRRQAVTIICAIHHHGTPVFYAGNAFALARARRGVPGLYLGADLPAACALTDRTLTAGSPDASSNQTSAAPSTAATA